MSSDVVGSRCQEVGMRGNGVVSIAFCAPEGISLGVHVPVHEIRRVGVKRKAGCVHAVWPSSVYSGVERGIAKSR